MKKIKYILVIYTVFLVSCNRNIHKQLIVNNQDESHLQSKSVIVPGSKIYEHKLPTVEKTGVVSEVIGNTKDSVQSHVENKAIKKDNLKNLSLSDNSIPQETIMDTVLKFVYDTIAKPSYPKINYLPYNDLSVIQKYFINDIIAPGDTMHPIYKKYIKASNDSIPTVMKSLKEKMGRWLRFYPSAGGMRAKDLIDRIGGISEIEKCQIKPILNYKLTPNVVVYKTGENIKNYFNLDTTKFFYAIFKNNKLVGLLFKRKYGDIVLTDCSVDYHIANYDFIKSVNKENESFFYVDMTIEKPGANYQQMINMCCLINNHIVHSFCERLKMTNETDSKLKDGQSYYLKYNSLQILDTRYLELFGKKTRLQREIEQFYSEIIK